jgi:uncharacterized membrane protein
VVKKNACIMCTEEIKKGEGNEVVEDKIIEIIRKVKNKLGVAKGYKLVVCDKCLEDYEKKRKRFERNTILYLGLGIVIIILLMILNFSIGSFIGGILIFLILLLFSIFSYIPRIKKKEVKKNERKQTKGRRKTTKK